MDSWDYPVRVAERTNKAADITLYDWPLHWHEQMEIQYVLSGGIEIYCHGRREWVYAGDVFFANWCDPHCSTAFLDGTRYYAIHLNVQWLMLSDEQRLAHYIDYMMTNVDAFQHFIRQDAALCALLDELIAEQRHKQVGYELSLIALGLKMLVHLRRECVVQEEPAVKAAETAARVPRRLSAPGGFSTSALGYNRQILYYLSHHYQQPLDLDSLSREIGLNKFYMCRIFKLYTGRSIIQYLTHLRCYMAVSIISNGISVTEAAERTGFVDYNYFSRVFKRVTGRRPSEVARDAWIDDPPPVPCVTEKACPPSARDGARIPPD